MKNNDFVFMGLDGEMTGGSVRDGCRLIQIGAAFNDETMFCSDIGWVPGSFQWNSAALEVCGFDMDRIHSGPTAKEVDANICDWLSSLGLARRGRVIPVGWNIIQFDMPFIRDALPNFSKLLQRRSVDLNAVCFSMPVRKATQKKSFLSWKGESKKVAKRILAERGVEENWHDAGYDALAAITSWNWLRGCIG